MPKENELYIDSIVKEFLTTNNFHLSIKQLYPYTNILKTNNLLENSVVKEYLTTATNDKIINY